jgi:hypothetical protein
MRANFLLFLCIWFNQRNGTDKTHQPISSCSSTTLLFPYHVGQATRCLGVYPPLAVLLRRLIRRPFASHSAQKSSIYSSQYTSGFCDLQPRIWPHLLRLVTNAISDRFSEPWHSDPMLPKSQIREKLFLARVAPEAIFSLIW